jgi:hypothetical protein
MTTTKWFVLILVLIGVLMLLSLLFKGKKVSTSGLKLKIDQDYKAVIFWAFSCIALVHLLIWWFMDKSISDSWFNSKAFWFSIISITIAVFLRLWLLKSNIWYYIMLVVLPILAICLQYSEYEPKDDVAGKKNIQKKSEPDTTYQKITSSLTTTFSSGESLELVMEPNSEVVQERSHGFKQVIKTDSIGFKTSETLSGDPMNAPVGKTRLTIKKGGPVMLKRWFD